MHDPLFCFVLYQNFAILWDTSAPRVHREIYADTPIFPLAFRAHIYMSNKSSKKARSSAQILAEIAAMPPSVQGTISSYKNVRKNGTAVVDAA